MSPGQLPRWSWLSAALLAAVLLLVLIAGSLSDAKRFALANNHLDTIDEQQARLSENILKLRYGLIANYDGINHNLGVMLRARAALGQGEAIITGKGNARIDELFLQYTTALNELGERVERFKSSNALLKNSLQYFPHAVEDTRHSLPQDGKHRAFADHLAELYFATSRYGTGADDNFADKVIAGIAALRGGDLARLPPATRQNALNVVAHADMILRLRPQVDDLTRQIVFPVAAPLIKELDRTLQADALAVEHRANRFRLGLATLAGLLLALVSYSLLRLMKSAQQLEDSHRFMDRISENIGDGVLATDKHGAIVFANREALRLTGSERAALLGKPLRDALPGSALWEEHDDGEVMRSEDETLRRSDGSALPVALVHVAIHEPGKLGAVMVFRDMTETRAREKDLRLAATVFEHSPYGITVTDGKARILRVNPAFSAITGYSEAEAAGKTPAILKSGLHSGDFYKQMWRELIAAGQWKGEIQNRRKDGSLYPEWLNLRAVKDELGYITHFVGIFSDESEHKESERRLEYLANYDTLTGLPNRVLFQDRINQAIAHMSRGTRVIALMYAGLDHFKIVNETLGVDVGDALLKAVAGRFLSFLRESDTVCRLGGDQFAILLDDVRNVDDVASKAQAILRTFAEPFDVGGHELFTSLSIGITLAPLDAVDTATLQRNADTAMFGAKELGRNTFQFYSADMSARMTEALRLENGLRQALSRSELVLHYQPQTCVSSNRVICVEALLRWTSPEFGAVAPSAFIPIAEKCGLIVPIGEWVLRTACAQIAAWRRAGIEDLRVAVNLSAVQFRQTDLVDLVRRVLAENNLEGRHLELEITESVVMADVERSIATLHELRALGCEIAVDDFGTGYSSLNYLKQFPINTLKIDQSFVRGLGSNADDAAVVNAIISLGNSLSLKIVAEGVEHDAHRSFFENVDSPAQLLLQGYHVCRPAPADQVQAFLSR